MNTSTAPDALDACRLVDVGELSALLKLSPRTIWRMSALAAAGRESFPVPVEVGPRLKRWRLQDVRSYLDGLSGRAPR